MAPPSDRHDFPNCKGCPYVNPGQWTICVPCAAEQLSSIKDPCPICAQERRDGHCHNRLCTRPASSRHFEGMTAITLHNDPLVDVMRRFKYSGKTGWGMIFARLLIGHLYETWDPADVDLIIANPPILHTVGPRVRRVPHGPRLMSSGRSPGGEPPRRAGLRLPRPALRLDGDIAASIMARPPDFRWLPQEQDRSSLVSTAQAATMAGGLQEVRPLTQHRPRVDGAESTALVAASSRRGVAADASGRRTR